MSNRHSPALTNSAIAERFRAFGDLLEIRGDDHFKVRAYHEAASTIRDWNSPIADIARSAGAKGLRKIPGVGKAISEKIVEIVETGTFKSWEKTVAETPVSVLELLTVDGVSTSIAAKLFGTFKIATIEDLRQFAEGGGLDMIDNLSQPGASRIRAALRI